MRSVWIFGQLDIPTRGFQPFEGLATGDAGIDEDFGGGTRLEVFNNSSGYESWMLNGPGGRLIVAQGGGNVAWGKL